MREIKQVVTYSSPGFAGARMDICPPCEKELLQIGIWPKDARGTELVNVEVGLHKAPCDICDGMFSETKPTKNREDKQ